MNDERIHVVVQTVEIFLFSSSLSESSFLHREMFIVIIVPVPNSNRVRYVRKDVMV